MRFYCSGDNSIGLHSSADSVPKQPYARTQTLLVRCSIALAYSPLIYIFEQEKGVPVRSKASQREGFGKVQKRAYLIELLQMKKISDIFYHLFCFEKYGGSGTISAKRKRGARASGEKLRANNPVTYPPNVPSISN